MTIRCQLIGRSLTQLRASQSDEVAFREGGKVRWKVLSQMARLRAADYPPRRFEQVGRPAPGETMSFSPDRRFWWDGHRWMPAVSQDGKWRWDGSAWTAVSSPSHGPGWVRAIFGLGPILGGLATAGLFFFATRDVTYSLQHAAITWVGLAVMRLIDPVLAPLWRLLGKVPGIVRFAATIAVLGWYSTHLGPAPSNMLAPQFGAVEHFQPALYISIALAYFLLRPSRGGYLKPA
jgi:hypothetical protein